MTGEHHLDRARLVRPPRPPMRRSRWLLHLLLSRLDVSGSTLTACIAPAGLWTAAMIALALAVRY